MPSIAVTPILLNDVVLTIAGSDYEAAVTKVQLDPTTNVVRWRGMTPTSAHTFVSSPEWTASLTYAQDWSTPNSLSAYLMANSGKSVPVTFVPKKGAKAPTVTVDLVIAPGSIGGDLDSVAQASVTLGVNGQPRIAPAAT